jgi:hypothetical protein
MQFFKLRKGNKAVVINQVAVINERIYHYEDLISLIDDGKLTVKEYRMIAFAMFNDKTTEEEIIKKARRGNYYTRLCLAMLGYALDILVSDPKYKIRATVATKGYGLEKLVHDPDPIVRCQVAHHGYGLDILVNDPEAMIRFSVAKKGYGLEKLVNDPSPFVRGAVAEQGYGLDILANDEDLYVQTSVSIAISKQKHDAIET